jgi:hypothetical protein
MLPPRGDNAIDFAEQRRLNDLCSARNDRWPPYDYSARGRAVCSRGRYNRVVDSGPSFGALSIDQQCSPDSAAVDQIEQRFRATVAPFDVDAINRDSSEASGL